VLLIGNLFIQSNDFTSQDVDGRTLANVFAALTAVGGAVVVSNNPGACALRRVGPSWAERLDGATGTLFSARLSDL